MYYKLTEDLDNFSGILPVNYSMELASSFDGRSHAALWEPIHFEKMDKSDLRPLPEILTGYIPICSARVYEAIKDVCNNIVEFLPCTIGDERLEYYVFNILGSLDVVDYDRSIYQRFPSTGRIMFFKKLVFKETVEVPLFRIPDLPYTYFFCTEEFKVLLEGIDCRGAKFLSDMF